MRTQLFFFLLIGTVSGVYLAHAQELPPIAPPTVAVPPTNPSPETAPPPSAPVAATPTSTPTAPTSTPVAVPAKVHEFTYKTLMFLPTELDSIAKIEADYLRVKSGQALPSDNKSSDTPKEAPEVQYNFPQFYLNSIAYRNATDWVVWINAEKYVLNSTKEQDTLHITSVTDKAVTVEWRPDLTEKITLALPNTPGVVIDKDNRIVTFTLQPNQTFLSYNMKIVEGKRPPISTPPPGEEGVIKALSGALPSVDSVLAPPPATSPPAPPTTPPATPDEASQTGLPGLINRYQDIDKQ